MHLFLLVPNNSGSSLLHDLIATSEDVAVLPAEGQFYYNFVGPDPIKLNVKHIFTEKEEIFRNKSNYEWGVIKSSWTSAWKNNKVGAKIKLQKSPTDIVRPKMLQEAFPDSKFIIMIRNPYAMIEGIMRGNPNATVIQAAKHALRCLEIQLENSEIYKNDLVLRYEDLTDDSENTVNLIKEYLELSDIDYNRTFYVKDYISTIVNKNNEQIKKLTDSQLEEINKIFKSKEFILSECGYEIIKPKSFNFKFLGSADTTNLKKKLNELNDEIWKEFTYRQETFDVHKKTNTVPLIFSEDFESENVKYHNHFPFFADDLLEISNALFKYYDFGYITRAILVKLFAGEVIPDHIDRGESLESCHRVHVPIITNESCYFSVGDETVNMKEGEFWEINNTNKIHNVKNLGNTDRIHLIVDWITID